MPGLLPQMLQNRPVAPVHAIVITDGGDTATMTCPQVVQSPYQLHRRLLTLVFSLTKPSSGTL